MEARLGLQGVRHPNIDIGVWKERPFLLTPGIPEDLELPAPSFRILFHNIIFALLGKNIYIFFLYFCAWIEIERATTKTVVSICREHYGHHGPNLALLCTEVNLESVVLLWIYNSVKESRICLHMFIIGSSEYH